MPFVLMGPEGDATGGLLDLDDFCDWIAQFLPSGPQITPETRLAEVEGFDAVSYFMMLSAFDQLVASQAPHLEEAYTMSTIRDLFLHYLYIDSMPLVQQ